MKKRMFSVISRFLVLVLVLNIFVIETTSNTYAATNLTDISNHWAKVYIQRLVDQQAITGYPNGSFKPDGTISRAAFITVLSKALKLDASNSNYFDDTRTHWAQSYISAAVDSGIIDMKDYINGTECLFLPDKNITRQEMAQMITRALGEEFSSLGVKDTKFKDTASINSKMVGYVATASSYGIITGYKDGSFLPNNSATRAEACVMITRLIDQIEIKPTLVEVDSEGIYSTYSKAVVMISGTDDKGEAYDLGSGFVFDKVGKVITNYHVIDGMKSIKVTFADGTSKNVTSIHNYDRSYDVAVLNLEAGNYSSVPLGNSRRLNVGEKIYTLGYPLVMNLTISDGLVSSQLNDENGHNYIQISAPISQGSSGGALVDKYGRVVGITSAGFTKGENMNLAIPICDVISIITAKDEKLSVETSCVYYPTYDRSADIHIFATNDSDMKTMVDVSTISIDEYKYIGFKVRLDHGILTKNNSYLGVIEIEDSYGDVIDNNYLVQRIYRGSETEESYLIDVSIAELGPGVYTFNLYFGKDLVATDRVTIKSDQSYEAFSPSSITISTFDYDAYEISKKQIVNATTIFKTFSTAAVGFRVTANFNKTFNEFTAILYEIKIEGPNGYSNQFSVDGQLYGGKTGFDFVTGYGNEVGEYPPGDYNVSLTYNGTVLTTTRFQVIAGSDLSIAPQDLKISQYKMFTMDDKIVQEPEVEYSYDVTIMIQMGTIARYSKFKFNYNIRCGDAVDTEYDDPLEVANQQFYEEYQLDYHLVTPDNSNKAYPLNMYIRLRDDIKANYLSGEPMYIDVYIDGKLFDSIDYNPVIPTVEYSLIDAMIIASPYGDYDGRNDYFTAPYANFKALEKSVIDLSDNKYLYYGVKIDAKDYDSDSKLVDYLLLELVKNDTGEVVDSKTYSYEFFENGSAKIITLSGIDLLNTKPTPGAYTLKAYTDKGGAPVFTKAYTFVQ